MLKHNPRQTVDVKKSNYLHSPNFASGTLTPSFGHGYAINKQEQCYTLAEPTVRKYLNQADNQSIKGEFYPRKKTKTYFLWHHHCCEVVQGGVLCSPLLTLDSHYIHLLSTGALSNKNKSNWSYIGTTLKMFGSLFKTGSTFYLLLFLIIKNPFFDFSRLILKPEEDSKEQVIPSATQRPLCYH